MFFCCKFFNRENWHFSLYAQNIKQFRCAHHTYFARFSFWISSPTGHLKQLRGYLKFKWLNSSNNHTALLMFETLNRKHIEIRVMEREMTMRMHQTKTRTNAII